MSIFLIRHGETDGNARRVVQVAETPLSERGLQQARLLGDRLRDAGIAHILASDLPRAAMTAEALERTTGLVREPEPLLQERNFGDVRGTPYDQLETDLFAPDFEPAAGESWEVFHERVARAWDRIVKAAAACDGHLAVVTHGLVLHSIVAHHVTLPEELAPPPRNGPPMTFGNTALTVVSEPGPWSVVRFACTEHLDAMEEESGAGRGGAV